jgi:hypothetical protein
MGTLRLFLMACSALFGLVGLGLLAVPIPLIVRLPLALGCGALGVAVFRQASRFGRLAATESDERFEALVRRLAAANDGVVRLSALVSQAGLPETAVVDRMRQLTGRGICELDFGEDGETRYRLTPIDEARASLAAMSERPR